MNGEGKPFIDPIIIAHTGFEVEPEGNPGNIDLNRAIGRGGSIAGYRMIAITP